MMMNSSQTQATTDVTPLLATPQAGLLQRKCDCGNHTGGGECGDCEKKRKNTLQRFAISSGPAPAVPSIVHEVLRSPGQPLSATTRAFFEPRFGYDFSGVRVHTDARAAESARAVNAQAYTVGRDVVFGAGHYAPQSREGRGLMAHELTHVIQQQQLGNRPQAKLTIGDSNDTQEREADQTARAVVSGTNKQPINLSSSQGVIQRACGSVAVGPTPPDCALTSAAPRGTRFKFNRNCDDFAPGEKARLQAFARGVRAASPRATINILGLASFDGDADLNNSLACHRATAADAIVRPEVASVGSVQAAVGGPTTAGDAEFRAVDIEVVTPAPPEPVPVPATPGCEFTVNNILGSRTAPSGVCTAQVYRLDITRGADTEILHVMWFKRAPSGATLAVNRTAFDNEGDAPTGKVPSFAFVRPPLPPIAHPGAANCRSDWTVGGLGTSPAWCVPFCSDGIYRMEAWVNWRCNTNQRQDIAHVGPIDIEVIPGRP